MSANFTVPKVRLLEPLTSFRFIAALFVFQWHTGILRGHIQNYELGYAGVSFFFVLSGFILTYVYTSRLGSGNWSRIKSFYAARIAKIYPVHILTFLMAFVVGAQTLNNIYSTHVLTKTVAAILMNLTLTQSYYPSNTINFSFNGVAWSISDEFFFYAFFPVLIYLVVRFRKTLTLRRLSIAWVAAWVIITGYLLTKQAVIDDWFYYIFPPLRMFDFMSGMVLGLIYLKITQTSGNFFDALRGRYFTALEIIALGLVSAAIFFANGLPQSIRFSMILIPFWLILIFTFAWQKGLISRVLSVKPLVFLGNVSFSFYMVHQIVIRTFLPMRIGHHALIDFLISLSLASAIYVFFEEPNRIRLKTYLEQLTLPAGLTKRLSSYIPKPKPAFDEQPVPTANTIPPGLAPAPVPEAVSVPID